MRACRAERRADQRQTDAVGGVLKHGGHRPGDAARPVRPRQVTLPELGRKPKKRTKKVFELGTVEIEEGLEPEQIEFPAPAPAL